MGQIFEKAQTELGTAKLATAVPKVCRNLRRLLLVVWAVNDISSDECLKEKIKWALSAGGRHEPDNLMRPLPEFVTFRLAVQAREQGFLDGGIGAIRSQQIAKIHPVFLAQA